jgi:hypothetical protein
MWGIQGEKTLQILLDALRAGRLFSYCSFHKNEFRVKSAKVKIRETGGVKSCQFLRAKILHKINLIEMS